MAANHHAHVVKDAKWFGGFLANVNHVMDADAAIQVQLLGPQVVLHKKLQLQLQPPQQQQQQLLQLPPRHNLADLVALDVHALHAEFGGCAHHVALQTAVVGEAVAQDVVILLLLNHHHLAVHALLV